MIWLIILKLKEEKIDHSWSNFWKSPQDSSQCVWMSVVSTDLCEPVTVLLHAHDEMKAALWRSSSRTGVTPMVAGDEVIDDVTGAQVDSGLGSGWTSPCWAYCSTQCHRGVWASIQGAERVPLTNPPQQHHWLTAPVMLDDAAESRMFSMASSGSVSTGPTKGRLVLAPLKWRHTPNTTTAYSGRGTYGHHPGGAALPGHCCRCSETVRMRRGRWFVATTCCPIYQTEWNGSMISVVS